MKLAAFLAFGIGMGLAIWAVREGLAPPAPREPR